MRSCGRDFRDDGDRACLGMCDAFAGDLHDSRITSHKSQVTCAQLGPPGILDLPNYGGVGNETLVMTARNKDCEDH